MKTLMTSLAVLLSFTTFASDSTGCPTMHTTSKEVTTAFGNNLAIQALNAAGPDCSYAKDSRITITYSWFQNSSDTPHVDFWTRVNNKGVTSDLTVFAYVSCNEFNSGPYFQKNYTRFKCMAKAMIGTGYQDKMNVEVAPLFDGQWDTRGYSQNYYFQF
ncbi:hypothetical protein SHI21_19310 [Bacteriovorax sp. PP10]|uniref:Secreted protein n=1 Tax=Bacteriovorax antarcticus TaxID=3088717 RepID=A0ABU5VZA4_9BACT|nr:hypothetical protein [Bacteriovorax sp. PP10]MEA9358393.1 hypothetical protein [Bacteriovorax sp. PP10]